MLLRGWSVFVLDKCNKNILAGSLCLESCSSDSTERNDLFVSGIRQLHRKINLKNLTYCS